jgi:capsular polysaccharide biosynthesis protein
VEVTEAFQRIVRVHFMLLAIFIALGVFGALVFGYRMNHAETTYTATARLVIDVKDPASLSEATAVADLSRAIVTSRSHVGDALAKAGAKRDTGKFVSSIKVSALGTSGVLQITVTDTDPRVAATVANNLAADLIKTRADINRSQTAELVKTMDDAIDARTAQINELKGQMDSLSITDPRYTGQAQVRAALIADRATYLAKRVDLLATEGQRPRASIVDPAQPPTRPDLYLLLIDLLVGLVVGLLLGVIAAAALESIKPNAVGAGGLARAAGVKVLAELPATTKQLATTDLGVVNARLARAAQSAGATTVELIGVRPNLDLGFLARALVESAPGPSGLNGGPGTGLRPPTLQISGLGASAFSNGTTQNHAAVLVTPSVIPARDLAEAAELVQAGGYALVGLIVFDRRTSIRSSARPAARQIYPNHWPETADGISSEQGTPLRTGREAGRRS